MKPNFHFKGSRTYLHSTTVFDWITSSFSEKPQRIDYVFNRKTAMQCVVLPATAEAEGDVIGTWRDAKHNLKIVEGKAQITERRPYAEDSIGAACRIDEGRIEIPADIGDATFIERLVAGYKALLLSLETSPDARFAFVRLRLAHIPETDVGIQFNRRLGAGFYQGVIDADGRRLGEIYFGRWK